MSTHGNFIRINTQHAINETVTQINPTAIRRILFNFGVVGLCVWSRITKPKPPKVNRNEDANPSIMYWPLTR